MAVELQDGCNPHLTTAVLRGGVTISTGYQAESVANMRFLCFTFLSAVLFSVGFAQSDGSEGQATQQQQFTHPLTNMPSAVEDVETSFLFPDHPDNKFPIGEVVTVLCHFSNDDQYAYNVTAIMGSLNSPYDFNFHVQNYSYKPIGVVVRPGDEFTFEYQFHLHPDLQPVEYALAHTVFYDDERVSYSSTFFNQTVELYYPTDDFDLITTARLTFSILSTIGLIFVSLFLCFPEFNFEMKKTNSMRGTHKSAPEEWLENSGN